MIIFNERNRIKNIIEQRDKNAIKSKHGLIKALVKYYYPQFTNKSWKEYQQFIISEMNQFGFDSGEYEEWEYANFIKRTCKNALNGNFDTYLRETDFIEITEAELDIISKAENDKQKKVLFTLYVLAKLYPYHSGWVNYRDSEIFKLANVHLNIEDRDYLIHDLYNLGLLQLNHIVGKSGFKVELAEESPAACKVTREDHFGNQYLLYIKNHEWIMCKNCGRLIKRRSPNQKYCKKCADQIQKEQINQWKQENSGKSR